MSDLNEMYCKNVIYKQLMIGEKIFNWIYFELKRNINLIWKCYFSIQSLHWSSFTSIVEANDVIVELLKNVIETEPVFAGARSGVAVKVKNHRTAAAKGILEPFPEDWQKLTVRFYILYSINAIYVTFIQLLMGRKSWNCHKWLRAILDLTIRRTIFKCT